MNKSVDKFGTIEICVTSSCNLRCTHCYQNQEKNIYRLSYEQIADVVDFARQHSCKNFVLSGGEFFTHPDAYKILGYILSFNDTEVVVVTNATLLDMEKLRAIASPDRVSFTISLDGDKDEHDKRRGQGMFAITENAIGTLRDCGYDVGITMTLVEDNLHCIPAVLNNPLYSKVTLMPVATTGAAIDHFANEQDSSAYTQIVKEIYRICHSHVEASHRCHLFPRGFSVKYDGGVYPCSVARDFGLFEMGNLNQQKIDTIVSSFLSKRESDVFFEYEGNSQIEKCNKCPQNKECTRGCRMRAYKWNGSLTTADPFACKLFNNEWSDVSFGNIYWGKRK